MASRDSFLEEGEALELNLMNGSHHPETFIWASKSYPNTKLHY